jgi:hypothetical protein
LTTFSRDACGLSYVHYAWLSDSHKIHSQKTKPMKRILTTIGAVLLVYHVQFAQTTYNHYFGNIHAQTSYSDGNKDSSTSHISTPLQAFAYAKASQHIDFYGISKEVYTEKIKNSNGTVIKTIDLSSYPKGTYLLSIKDNKGESMRRIFIQ